MNYNQPTLNPTQKVTAVGAAGAVIVAIVAVLSVFGVTVPPELSDQATQAVIGTMVVVSFVQAALQFFAGYWVKEKAPSAADVAKGIVDTAKGGE